MEGLLAVIAERANETDPTWNTQRHHPTPKHERKHLSRRKSLFSLASHIFKSNPVESGNNSTLQEQIILQAKGSWNPFLSLRGSRENKKRSGKLATARCKSSSPQKNEMIGEDFGKQKPMKRKSLQDLLGTVGGKFSRTRRQEIEKDILPTYESLSEESNCTQDIPPLILPEPILPVPSGRDTILGSLYQFEKKNLANSAGADDSASGPWITRRHSSPAIRYLPVKPFRDGVADKIEEESFSNCGDYTSSCVYYASIQNETAQVLEATVLHGNDKSQDSKEILSSRSSKDLCPALPTKLLCHVSPALAQPIKSVKIPKPFTEMVAKNEQRNLLTLDRGLDEEASTSFRYSEILNDTANSLENVNLDPSFPTRALTRKGKYESISHRLGDNATELSSQEIARHIISTAAKISENFHLSTSPRKRSVGSSSTDTDDLSHYSWDANKAEFWDVIERGREIMKMKDSTPQLPSNHPISLDTSPTISSNLTKTVFEQVAGATQVDTSLDTKTYASFQSTLADPSNSCIAAIDQNLPAHAALMIDSQDASIALSSSEVVMGPVASSTFSFLAGEERQRPSHVGALVSKYGIKQEEKPKMLLKTGERFRPIRESSDEVITNKIREIQSQTNSQAILNAELSLESEAPGDMHQNYTQNPQSCLFDPACRTPFAQMSRGKSNAERPQPDDGMESLLLPMQFGVASPALPSKADGVDSNLQAFTDYVFSLGEDTSLSDYGFSSSDFEFIQSLDTIDLDLASSDGHNQPRWDSSHKFDNISGHDFKAECNDPPATSAADHPRREGVNQTVVTVQRSPALGREVSVSGSSIHASNDIECARDMAVDPATVRLYLGSSYSSTGSIISAQCANIMRPDTVSSICNELGDTASRDTRRVETWADLGKDFLEKYAPDGEASPARRTQIAVEKALKKRRASVASSGDGQRSSPDHIELTFAVEQTQQREWSRDRETGDDITFKHIEDIAKYESDREQLLRAAFTSCSLTNVSQEPDFGTGSCDDSTCKEGNKEVSHGFISSWLEAELAERQLFQKSLAENSITGTLQVEQHKPAGQNVNADRTEHESPDRSTLGRGRISVDSERSSIGHSAIAMMSNSDFSRHVDKPQEITKNNTETQKFVQDSEVISHKYTLVTLPGSGFNLTLPTSQTPDKDIESATKIHGNMAQPSGRKLYENKGVADVVVGMTIADQQSPRMIVGDSEMAKPRIPSHNYVEALSSPTSRIPRLSVSPERTRISAYSSTMKSPGSGQKRILTPNRRAFTPLAELSGSRNSEILAPPASEAETEVSEGFGQMLQRCNPIEDDEKENNGRWHRDPIQHTI